MLQLAKEVVVNLLFSKHYFNKKIIQKSKNASKPKFILSFDPDEENDIKRIPWLLELLKKYNIKASFAAIGIWVEKYPLIFKQIIDEGHELINHTYSHPDNPDLNPYKHFNKISSQERFNEIKKCDEVVFELLKYKMNGFRIPHFGNQFIEDIYPMLEKLNYSFSSSTLAIKSGTGGDPYMVGNIKEFPIMNCPKHAYCIFDTSHAFRAKIVKHSPDDFINTFKDLLSISKKHNLFLNLYQDPQDLHKFDYEKFLKLIDKNRSHFDIVVYGDIL
ncbi:polysaccharide deacetylase family protein [Candidatus Woesearchaeota archaeon]|nr:polysaccharide deacetylase family protein [Candidatus Woesearchaeota archaeon]